MRHPILSALERAWKTDWALTGLLVSLVAVIFVYPAWMSERGGPQLWGEVGFQLIFALIFVSGIRATTPSRWLLAAATVPFAAVLILFWIDRQFPDQGFAVGKAVAGAITAAMLAALVLWHVLRDGPITFDRIGGAIAAYLLIGFTWGNIYEAIALTWPGAFSLPSVPANPFEFGVTFSYLSFVTLTTVGFGDIVPVHPAARSAVVLEAFIGQLFPAILIARLVAMELSARDRRRSSRTD